MSSFEVIRGDVNLEVTGVGQAHLGLEELRRQFQSTTGAMSTDALKAAVAQEKLDKAIARHGATSTQAKAATVRYREEMASLGRTSVRTGGEVNTLERDISKLGRGAAVGTGLMRGLGRAAAFSSASFLGGAGLVYAIRTATKAAQDHAVREGQLRTAVTAAGLSYGPYREQIDAAIASQEKLGFSEEDSVKAFTKLVVATQDVTKAQKYQGLAADIARKFNVDLAVAANAVARALGGQTGALRRIDPSIKAGVTSAKALQQAQHDLAGSAEDYASRTAGAHDRAGVAIHHEEVLIGQGLLPVRRRLDDEIATYLGKAENQHRIQRDVNQAIKDGTAIVHGLVDAEKLIAPPIKHAVDALGGLENAVETALVLGLALKAKRAATALGLIKAASVAVRTQIVKDAAVEEGALAGVAATAGSAADVAGAAGAAGAGAGAGAAGGLLRGAAIGGTLATALSRGGRLLAKGGELYLIYKGVQFAIGKLPATSQTGPNRYNGSDLGSDWSNFLGDLVHHPVRAGKDLGEGLLNELGVTHYGSKGRTGGGRRPAILGFEDVAPLIKSGVLHASQLVQLKQRFRSPADYNGALAYAHSIGDYSDSTINVPSGATGSFTPAGYLSPAQKRAQALAANPNSVAALRGQRDYDIRAIAFLNRRFAAGKIGGPAYLAQYQTLEANRQEQQSQLDQIAADANAKRVAATRRAAAEARRQATAARRAQEALAAGVSVHLNILAKETGPLGVNVAKLEAADKRAQRARVAAVKRQIDLRNQNLQNDLALAHLAETQAGTNTAALARAHKAEIAAEYAILREEQKQGKGLTGLARAENVAEQIATRQAIADLKHQTATARGGAQANERQFLAAFQQIFKAYGGNTVPLTRGGGMVETHLYDIKHETRRQTAALTGLIGHDAFPASRHASGSAAAAFG